MVIDEDNKTEFKEIVAFLNSDGGTIYIGINKSKQIVGVKDIDESMRIISDIVTDQISPRCISFVNQSHDTFEGKEIIKINVKKAYQRANCRAFKR